MSWWYLFSLMQQRKNTGISHTKYNVLKKPSRKNEKLKFVRSGGSGVTTPPRVLSAKNKTAKYITNPAQHNEQNLIIPPVLENPAYAQQNSITARKISDIVFLE